MTRTTKDNEHFLTLDLLNDRYIPDFENGHLIRRMNIRGGGQAGSIAGWNDELGYRCIQIGEKVFYLHRVLFFMYYESWPEVYISHVDHDPGNNSISNLMEATNSETQKHARKRIDNTTGQVGVSKLGNGYLAEWRVDQNRKYKYFKNFDDAVALRQEMERKHGYKNNKM